MTLYLLLYIRPVTSKPATSRSRGKNFQLYLCFYKAFNNQIWQNDRPHIGQYTNIHGFISSYTRLITKLGKMVQQYALTYLALDVDVIISKSYDKNLWLHYHLCNSCNNQTQQDGKSACNELILQVIVTSLSTNQVTNVYWFISFHTPYKYQTQKVDKRTGVT